MQGLLIIAEVIVVVGLVAIMFTVEPTGTAVLSLTGIMAILCFYKISAKYLQKIGNARQEADALRLRALQRSLLVPSKKLNCTTMKKIALSLLQS